MASVTVPGTERGLRRLARRPSATRGVASWLTTADHKKIGIMYGVASFVFFLVGGLEALLIRVQLARPDQAVLDPAAYNQIFTMHGVTMVFFVVMPLSAAFINYLVPLMIGADRKSTRLNSSHT